jgi:protein-L-isoaspartate(D-aspartate) O-methyltransferase
LTTAVEPYQQRLLETARRIFDHKPIPAAIEQAFLATPRHRFVKRFRTYNDQAWVTVNEANLAEHLSTLYSDQALRLVEDEQGETISSISQPSLVLYMLDMLKLAPGQAVFELGAGSGWNAALLGHLVGPGGQVYSTEILPEQAQEAAANIIDLGLDNVHVIATDGGAGYAAGAPYDRVIFTAGTYDLPHFFYDQIKAGGLLLVVIKIEGGGDTLFLLKKVGSHFEAIDALPCGFVPVTGRYAMTDLNPIELNSWPVWDQLKARTLFRRPFWWNGI